jgi:hypothetical protein
MTITIGLWVIPALLTLLAVVDAITKAKNTDIEEQIVLVTAIYIFICSWFIWTTYFTILYFLR